MKLENLLGELESSNSRLHKEAILKKYKDSPLGGDLIELLQNTYDPYRRFKVIIGKLPRHGTKGIEETIEQLFLALDVLAESKGVTDQQKAKMVYFLCDDCDEKTQELYKRVINKDLKCGVQTKTINKVFGDIIPGFDVQLAQRYDGSQTGTYYASPKMDGNRAVALKNEGGWTLYSRNGQTWETVPHINKALEKLEEFGITWCDGELYTDEFPFEKIQSVLRSWKTINNPQAKLVKYYIFWVGTKEDFVNKVQNETGPTIELMEKIHKTRNEIGFDPLEIVPQYKIELTPESAHEINKKYVSEGFEGAMFRHEKIGYDFKRSKLLLKYKRFHENDFEVVGFEEGTGKNKDSLGAIVVSLGDGNICSVGSGFTDEMREKVWTYKKYYLGKFAEVKFQDYTKLNINEHINLATSKEAEGKGERSLRFPIFLKWKLDR